MSVRIDGDVIRLEGDCFIEDAEMLASLLHIPGQTVDLSQCRRLHTALLQALLVFRPSVNGMMDDEAVAALLVANLKVAAS